MTRSSDLPLSDQHRTWAFHQDPIVRRNRIQAMNAFPFIAAALINRPHATDEPVLQALQCVIDRGEPLISTLSRLAGVAKGSVRAMRGVQPGEGDDPVNLVIVLRALDRISPDKRPRDGDQWRLFNDLMRWAGCANDLEIGSPKYSEDLIFHLIAGLMAANATQLSRWLGPNCEHLNGIHDYLEFAGLWCASGAGEVASCAYVKSRARRILRDELMMRYSGKEIVRQADRWHKEIHRNTHNFSLNTSIPDVWPALPGLPYGYHDLIILPLTTSALLVAEGARLEHCAGTYSDSCWSGEGHVVSIRDAVGQSLSTAELSISETPDSQFALSVVQHHSFRNGSPPQACIDALADYMQSISTEMAQAALDELGEFHMLRNLEFEGMDLYDNERSALIVSNIMRRVLPEYEQARHWLLDQLDMEDAWYRFNNERAAQALRQFHLDESLSEKEAFEFAWDTGRWECLDAGLRPVMV